MDNGYEIKPRHKEKLEDASIDFLLTQAEAVVKSTVETSHFLLNRANSLLQIFIPILVVTTGFIVSLLNDPKVNVAWLIISIAFLFLMIVCFILSVRMYYLMSIQDIGCPPNKVICDELVLSEKQLREIKLNTIENYQDSISNNVQGNTQRANLFRFILWTFTIGIAVILVVVIPLAYCLGHRADF